jgi:hypothetical protein
LIDTWIVVRELEEDVSKKRIRGLFFPSKAPTIFVLIFSIVLSETLLGKKSNTGKIDI